MPTYVPFVICLGVAAMARSQRRSRTSLRSFSAAAAEEVAELQRLKRWAKEVAELQRLKCWAKEVAELRSPPETQADRSSAEDISAKTDLSRKSVPKGYLGLIITTPIVFFCSGELD